MCHWSQTRQFAFQQANPHPTHQLPCTGVLGSELIAHREPQGGEVPGCPIFSSPFNPLQSISVWPPGAIAANRACWPRLLRLSCCDGSTGGLIDAPGVRVAAALGGPRGVDYGLFAVAGYSTLAAAVSKAFPSSDVYGAPYDFRRSPTGLGADAELSRIADAVSRAVALANGRRAVLVGHSMGSLVAAALLTRPDYASWR